MSNTPLDQHIEVVREDLRGQTGVMHVHATLRIFHRDLDPAELSKRFDVDPSHSHRRGDLDAAGTPYLEGAWLIDSKTLLHLTDPDKHIEFVLDMLAHRTSVLRQLLQADYHIDLLCTWLNKSESTHPFLSADNLRRLASIGIGCSFRVQTISDEEYAAIRATRVPGFMLAPSGPPPKPTDEWKVRSIKFPTLYPMNGVERVERALDEFLTKLQKISPGLQEQFKEAVKDVVLELNDISHQFPMLIETGEREELCLFIHEHARAAGLQIGERDDITEEWRTW